VKRLDTGVDSEQNDTRHTTHCYTSCRPLHGNTEWI